MEHSVVTAKAIASWSDLAERLDLYRDRQCLFRGESDDRYLTLLPKVGRVSKKPGSARKLPYSFDDEERVFKHFKRAVRPYLSHEPKSELEWLAVAQHHGLPTRLLDWTESLLVAAFFAVKLTGTPGVIYCLRNVEEISQDAESDPLHQQDVFTYHPPHISPRIPAQQSVFTIHPTPDKPFTHPLLERWIIEQPACWPIKRALNAAGITPASLFPGIDGLSEHLAWMYKWGYFNRSRPVSDDRGTA